MKIWVGDDLTFPAHTMFLMVLYFLLPRITTLTYTYREAAGLWWEDRFRPIIATVVNLGLNILLVNVIGMDGVIISTLVCTVFINVPWGTFILFKNYFQRTITEYLKKIFFYLLVTGVAGGITSLFCSCFSNNTILSLIIKGIICCIIPNCIFYLCYHRMDEYKFSKQIVNRVIEVCFKKRG